MSFLPIVERELRVAARQRLTFWTRASAAALALLVFGGLQILSGTAGGGYLKAGQIQFSFLKWLSFLFAAVMGIFLTADSLSYEKREGTLGLLFLTDLRGYDVVLGKLISHSLRAFYGLLAALPVLGLTLMVGGVTGPEFCRVMLVICNTLFLSLAIGLFVSSISRDVMKAMNGTVLILLVFMIGLPWVDAMVAARGSKPFLAVLSYASPGYLFATTGAYSLGNYWLCLGIQQLLGWGFLVLACLFAPRFWQQKSAPAKSARTAYFQPILYGSRRSRLKLRRKLLARNPMLWLTLRESRFVWAISLVVLYLLAWSIFTSSNITATLRTAASSQLLFVAGLMLWLASQACRFFVDASRNGALELLLVTPVGPEQIVRCQWTALRRTFLLPALLVIFMQLAGPIASILEMDTTTYATGTGGVNFNYTGMIISSAIAGVLKFLGNLAAVAWFGMWMGLTTRSTSMAIFKTLVFALALPALFLLFVQAITLFAGAMAGGAFWFGPVAVAVVSLAKNIFFIIWSRNRLLTRFREAVVREGHAPKYRTPPPLPLVVPPPLVSASVAAPPVPTNTEV